MEDAIAQTLGTAQDVRRITNSKAFAGMFPASQPSLSRSHRGWRDIQPGLERGPQRLQGSART